MVVKFLLMVNFVGSKPLQFFDSLLLKQQEHRFVLLGHLSIDEVLFRLSFSYLLSYKLQR